MASKSPWKRISASFRKLFSSSKDRNSKPAHSRPKVRISYPHNVRSSAPISPPPHRKTAFYKSKYYPTPAEEEACSDVSFTCVGLHDFREPHELLTHPVASNGPLVVLQRPRDVPSNNPPSRNIIQPETTPSTNELCSVCHRQPIQELTGVCRNCPPSVDLNRISRWSISDYFRDSFVFTRLDPRPSHIVDQHELIATTKQESGIYNKDARRSVSVYDGTFNIRESGYTEGYSFAPVGRDQRWSEVSEDVSGLEDWPWPYENQSRLGDASFPITQSSRWSEETEDVPDRYLDYRRY